MSAGWLSSGVPETDRGLRAGSASLLGAEIPVRMDPASLLPPILKSNSVVQKAMMSSP